MSADAAAPALNDPGQARAFGCDAFVSHDHDDWHVARAPSALRGAPERLPGDRACGQLVCRRIITRPVTGWSSASGG